MHRPFVMRLVAAVAVIAVVGACTVPSSTMGGSLMLSTHSIDGGRRTTTLATATFPVSGFPELSSLQQDFAPLLPGHGTIADRVYPAIGVSVLPIAGLMPGFELPPGAVTIGTPSWMWTTRAVDAGQRMRRGGQLTGLDDQDVLGLMVGGIEGEGIVFAETFAVCSAYMLDTVMALSAEEPSQPDAQLMGMWIPPSATSYAGTTGFGMQPASPGSTLVAQMPITFSGVPDSTIFKVNVTMVRWFDLNDDGDPMPVADTDGDGTNDDADTDDDGDGTNDDADTDDDGDGFADDVDPGVDDLLLCDRSSRTTVTVTGPSGLPTDANAWHTYEEAGDFGEILYLFLCLLLGGCPSSADGAGPEADLGGSDLGPKVEELAGRLEPVLEWAGLDPIGGLLDPGPTG